VLGRDELSTIAQACVEHDLICISGLRDELRAKRDHLRAGLAAAGLRPLHSAGTYFVNADVGRDAVSFCRTLPERLRRRRDPHRRVLRRQDRGTDVGALRLL
jgi:aspartate/methionine/tyrosine aminotransferase